MPSLSEQPSLCNNRLLALIWRCLIVVICCYGLYPMFFGAPFSGQILCYFTTQSNLLVAGMFLVLAIGTLQQLRKSGARGQVYSLWPPLQLAVVFFIQITFLVFAFVLSRTMFSMGRGIGLSNLLLHYVVPIMALIDWVLLCRMARSTIGTLRCGLRIPRHTWRFRSSAPSSGSRSTTVRAIRISLWILICRVGISCGSARYSLRASSCWAAWWCISTARWQKGVAASVGKRRMWRADSA